MARAIRVQAGVPGPGAYRLVLRLCVEMSIHQTQVVPTHDCVIGITPIVW